MTNAIAALTANSMVAANAASNVANLNTENYKSIRTIIKQGATGEPAAVTQRTTTPGTPTEDGSESSNVDLAQEFGDLMLARSGYEAALGAIRKREEMLDELMELFK